MFLGSFSTAKVAKGLNREAAGFEISKNTFDYQIREFEGLEAGYLLDDLRRPPKKLFVNSGKPITREVQGEIFRTHSEHLDCGITKKQSIELLSEKFGRGYWSILRIVDGTTNTSVSISCNKQRELDLPDAEF